MERGEVLEALLEKNKESLLHDFLFNKDAIISALARAGFVTVGRGTAGLTVAPLSTSTQPIPVPAGYVLVPYDLQVDVSVPFNLQIYTYLDNTAYFIHLALPSTFNWRSLGWQDVHDSILFRLVNTSAVSTIEWSLIIRYIRFPKERWDQFEENILHPLQYYAKILMEKEI